jgi:hypothetical protein
MIAMGATRTVVLGPPPPAIAEFLERRRALGQDLFDEVWEGEYHVVPAPHPTHGIVDNQLAVLLAPHARAAGLVGSGPFNLGDPRDFRVPDRGYHRHIPRQAFVPTAAVVVEMVSPGDETFAKFGFYVARDVDELLTADPDTRQVRCWRRREGGYDEVDRSDVLGVGAAELTAAVDWP